MCPICSAAGATESTVQYDDRYGYPGMFTLLACQQCGHRWLDWRPDAAILQRLYTDYYPRSQRSADDVAAPAASGALASWWRGRRSSAAAWVPRNVRVLDIGCGFGESLAYHRARGCEVWGVEADRNIARVAAKHGFNVDVGLFDPARYEPGYFDYVTMDQVIEHVVDPVATLTGVASVLHGGGTLVATTPNASGALARLFGRRWINWHTPYHLHFFSPASLALAAEQAGFSVVKHETITSSEWLSYQWIHLLTAPPEGTASPFWTGRRGSLQERATIKALRLAHRTGIDHMVTRVCDSLGAGDNFVVQLRRRDMR